MYIINFIFVFFFSSRRQHTRSYGDWGSDVCSSDLASEQRQPAPRLPLLAGRVGRHPGGAAGLGPGRRPGRSEERRVGKEWSPRWARVYGKKKEVIEVIVALCFVS